ncbi:MAG: Reversal of tor2 lethality [Caeruleum heppii]|nr:MAG: Reversal of tor2 lethality [Caeruleum heppii]
MSLSLPSLLLIALSLISVATAAIDQRLVGTWSTKSNKVFTGPGFYDPVNDKLIEPELTGISYSFTQEGYFEEAYYRAVANPKDPKCPKGIMQFQHGVFAQAENNSLILRPYGVDGRQLFSNPCKSKSSVYSRYNQPEMFQRFEVIVDPYHNVFRLNLYKFDGAPMQPMYLAYRPPQMLPTKTMNPTATATATGGQSTGQAASQSTGNAKAKRGLDALPVPLNKNAIRRRQAPIDADKWWWIGAGITALGGVGYLCF